MISAVACSALLAYALPAPATGDRLSEKPTQWHTLSTEHSDTGYASRDQRVAWAANPRHRTAKHPSTQESAASTPEPSSKDASSAVAAPKPPCQ